MRKQLAVAILFRSPVRTALTFLLLGMATFALFSQAAEYAILSREVSKAAGSYKGLGYLEASPPDVPFNAGTDFPHHLALDGTATGRYELLSKEQIGAISALPYVTSADARHMTAGFSGEFARLDDGDHFFNFTARCVVEATVASFEIDYEGGYRDIWIDILDANVLAGEQHDFGQIGQDGQTRLFASDIVSGMPEGSFASGNVYGIHRGSGMFIGGHSYGQEHIWDLGVGSRYAFVLNFDPLNPSDRLSYQIGDYLSDPWCGAVWPLDGAPVGYLDQEEYAALRELVEIMRADSHTFDMVYTDDLAAIPRFQNGKMSVMEGRAITREDSENAANVCVISRELAEAYDLSVGDTIPIELGGLLFEQYLNLGAIAGTRERHAPPVASALLEIVGIYRNMDGANARKLRPHHGYSVNAIFVPGSLLPVGKAELEGHEYAPGEFSFIVGDARKIRAFLNAAETLAEGMGLTLVFDDGGWLGIEEEFRAVGRLSIIKIGVFAASVVASTALAVYMFISRRKKDYAIMRSLGTVRAESAKALAYPLLLLAAAAIIAGGAAAWIYTAETVEHGNALVLLEEHMVETSVPIGIVVVCMAGQMLLLLLSALWMLSRIGKLPPLALLHGTDGDRSLRNTEYSSPKAAQSIYGADGLYAATAQRQGMTIDGIGNSIQSDSLDYSHHRATLSSSQTHKSSKTVLLFRYISRHIRRSAVKSGLVVLTAVLLFAAIGQLSELRKSYDNLLIGTKISASFAGTITLSMIAQIEASGLVSGTYYEGLSRLVDIKRDDMTINTATLSVTNDISRHWGSEVDVTFADGYDSESIGKFGASLVIGREYADIYGLELGDIVGVSLNGLFDTLMSMAIASHRLRNPNDGLTDSELFFMYFEQTVERVKRQTFDYVVAGIIETRQEGYFASIYTPGNRATPTIFESVDSLEAILADNERADDFRALARGYVGQGIEMVMDTGKLEGIRNSRRLLEMLYPMAVAAALLIGGFLCCLAILQSSKEAAIMRVLGTTKALTRAMLAVEQSILCAAGLLLSVCAMLAARRLVFESLLGQPLLFAAYYFVMILVCGIICSALATRKPPLELLQVRE